MHCAYLLEEQMASRWGYGGNATVRERTQYGDTSASDVVGQMVKREEPSADVFDLAVQSPYLARLFAKYGRPSQSLKERFGNQADSKPMQLIQRIFPPQVSDDEKKKWTPEEIKAAENNPTARDYTPITAAVLAYYEAPELRYAAYLLIQIIKLERDKYPRRITTVTVTAGAALQLIDSVLTARDTGEQVPIGPAFAPEEVELKSIVNQFRDTRARPPVDFVVTGVPPPPRVPHKAPQKPKGKR